MEDLIKRLEAAECGSNALDIEVLCLIDGFAYERRGRDLANHLYHADGRRREGMSGAGAVPTLYKVSRSIDAALALAERVLPGWVWQLSPTSAEIAPKPWHYAESAGENGGQTVYDAPTPALGLCIAILKATTASAVGTNSEAESEPK